MAEVIAIREARRGGLAVWPPCPPWCVYHVHSGDQLTPPDRQWCSHYGPRFRLTYRDPSTSCAWLPDREIAVELGRDDAAGRAGVPYLAIAGIGENAPGDRGLEPLSVDDAERFARLLLRVVGEARRAGRHCAPVGAPDSCGSPRRPLL